MTPADRVFMEFVKSAGSDASSKFDAFCRKHPGLESELRKLYDWWKEGGQPTHQIGPEETVSEYVKDYYDTVLRPIDLAGPDEDDSKPPDDDTEEEIRARQRNR